MGRGFTSGGQEQGSVFSAPVYKIRGSERHVESLPLVLKDRRSCFSQDKRFAGNHLYHLLSNNLDTGQECMPKRCMKFWSVQ